MLTNTLQEGYEWNLTVTDQEQVPKGKECDRQPHSVIVSQSLLIYQNYISPSTNPSKKYMKTLVSVFIGQQNKNSDLFIQDEHEMFKKNRSSLYYTNSYL